MSLGITSASVSTALASVVWYGWAAIRESEGNAATHQSLVSVLEHQLEMCGPENLHCPPARDYCSWSYTFFVFLSGVCIGVLAGVALVLCFWYRHRLSTPTSLREEVNDEPPQVAVSRGGGSPGRRIRGEQLALTNAQLGDLGL